MTALLRSLRRPSIRTAIGAIALTGCLCVVSQNAWADNGTDGSNGSAGTPGAAQNVSISTQANIAGVANWGTVGAAGTSAGNGGDGDPGAGTGFVSGGAPATTGFTGGKGGTGGIGGAGGTLTVNVAPGSALENLNFPGNIIFGANGADGIIGGNAGEGGIGGSGEGFYIGSSPYRNGANGGAGGTGGSGGTGGAGGNVAFTVTNGMVFLSGTQFGGTGGTGGVGNVGGTGGEGGFGAAGQAQTTYTALYDGGNGGNGGNGGVGGNGGNGGNGANATVTLSGGTTSFTNATFGGNGGKGGNGGNGGVGGAAGLAGATGTGTKAGNAGAVGLAGQQGNGGNGGNGGIGNVTLNGGYADFSGTTYFGGNGGAAGTGKTNGTAGAAGHGSLTINTGTANLKGDLTFRGTGSTLVVNGGTLSFENNRTISLGTGTLTVADGSVLSRSTDTGVLTVNAGTINGPASGKIVLDVVTSGDFLSTNVLPTNLTSDSFDLSGYRQGTVVTQNGNKYTLTLGTGAMPLEWVSGGNGNWQIGNTRGGDNWSDGTTSTDVDFMTGDIANFKGQAQGTVNLVGLVNPGSVNITAGTYTFAGTGYLSGGDVNVSGGANLTLDNTVANTYANTNIGGSSTVTAKRTDSLGQGTVNNSGTLNLDITTTGELTNVLAGTGVINKTGTGNVILTGDSTATGTLNVTTGSVQIGNGGTTGSYSGNIVSAADVVFNRNSDSAYAKDLTGSGKLIKEGTGALTLSGSAASGVDINRGSIILGNAAALGTGAGVNTNGTLDVNGIAPTSPIDLNGGSLVNNSSTAATVNNVALNAGSKIGGSGSLTIDNTLTGGFDLEKTGTGTTTLTKDNDLGTTTVSGGKLQLTGNGSAGDNVVLGNGTSLIANGVAAVASDISGAGGVDVLKDTTLSGTNSYTGGTNVTGSTLTGNLPNGGNLSLSNANYDLGGANRTIGTLNADATSSVILGAEALTIANGGTLGGQITGTGNTNLTGGTLTVASAGSIVSAGVTTVTTGTTLEVTAAQNASDAAIQNGSLVLASGSTLKTNFVDYTLQAGGETPVYLGNALTGYADNGAALTVNNNLYKIVGSLNYSNGQLYYSIKRRFGKDIFPNSPEQIWPTVDNYDSGGNNFIENLTAGGETDATVEFYGLSALDLVNLSNAMSALYDTQTGINNTLYNRSQTLSRASRRGGNCDPCGSCNSGSDRQIWATPFYGNSRGFGLNTGNFRHGYVNDQYGISFGIDKAYGQTSFGVMGIGGGGKLISRGQLARTENETGFGGVYFYSNTRRGSLDALITAGWLGMENDVKQFSYGGNLSGKVSTGLASFSATLTETYKFDGLRLLPSVGIEYGYYSQGSMTAAWGGQTSFYNEKAGTNLAVIPVGVRVQRDGIAFGGRLTPEFRARYIANVGSVSSAYKTWMTGSTASALLATRMTDRHAGDLGLGFGWTRQDVSFRGDVGYLFSEHYGDLSVSATGAWKF